jgi:hypothetical protein
MQALFMSSKKNTETRGGMRVGSGRKKSMRKTKTISFRVDVELAEQIKKIVSDYVNKQPKA